MPKKAPLLEMPQVRISKQQGNLSNQIFSQLRDSILCGTLPAGTRLPSTRTLAEDLGVSRVTVIRSYRQLAGEGYLIGDVGSGTRVTENLPDLLLSVKAQSERMAPLAKSALVLSRRGERIANNDPTRVPYVGKAKPFRMALIAHEEFPWRTWRALYQSVLSNPQQVHWAYSMPVGYLPLREQLVSYLATARGVRCTPEQIIITSGSQQALDLIARLFIDPGDTIWVENPGYVGARAVLRASGANLEPIEVGGDGLAFDQLSKSRRKGKLLYLTPAHQFPLGTTIGIDQRLRLLEWASENNVGIIEDDYNGEFRFEDRPLQALQGLDTSGNVLYVGTFSKTVFPALRIGYLVVPKELAPAFAVAKALTDWHSPVIEQAVMTRFLREGHFSKHMRAMRRVYGERRAVLVDAINKFCGSELQVLGSPAGMHLTCLGRMLSDNKFVKRLAKKEIEALALSSFYLPGTRARQGILLGFSGFTPEKLKNKVELLASELDN